MEKGDDAILERLQQLKPTPEVLKERQKAVDDRVRSLYQKAQVRLGELIDRNSSLPCAVSTVQVVNARRTRRGFLESIVSPLLSSNRKQPLPLNQLLSEASSIAEKLDKFDIYEKPISVYLDRRSKDAPTGNHADVDVYIAVRERGRLSLKTGTDIGYTEGSAYINALYRNIFGGAESLNFNTSLGTRTRSAHQLTLTSPLFSNPDILFQLGGGGSTTSKPWQSHEEGLKGGWARIRKHCANGSQHEFGYNWFWRQVTALAANASPSVRADAGDSVKSSISHVWNRDTRDVPLLPSRGHFARVSNELAGLGPLSGDVAFTKSEIETQGAVPIPLPWSKAQNSGISFTAGFRAGLLCPFGQNQRARINDRFTIGGPTDVRGFRLCTLGPRDGVDSLGGDVYAAASANLLFPLPRLGPETPARIQTFISGGRLFPLQQSPTNKTVDNIAATASELGNGLPSIAAGIGLVYALPVARLELNFSLPLVVRRGEEGRKGLQLGVGVNFL